MEEPNSAGVYAGREGSEGLRPSTMRSIRGIILTVLLSCSSHTTASEPSAFRLEGLPHEAAKYWSISNTRGGIVAACVDGLVLQRDGGWQLHRPPGRGEVKLALPVNANADEIVVAGTGLCWIWRSGEWVPTGLDGNFRSGVTTKDGCLFVSRRTAYLLRPGGMPTQVHAFAEDSDAFIHLIGGRPHLFSGRTVYRWDGDSAFQEITEPGWEWARARVPFLHEEAEGRLAAATSGGAFYGDGPQEMRRLPTELWDSLRKQGVTGISRDGEWITLSLYLTGLVGVRPESKAPEWTVDLTALEGNPSCLLQVEEGLIAGGSSGLHLVPDPKRFRFTTLPLADIYSAVRTQAGLHVVTGAGIFQPDGSQLEKPIRVISMAETPQGDRVYGNFGKLLWNDHEIALPGSREVGSMAALPDGRVIAMQPSGTSLVEQSGRVVTLPHASVSYTAAGAQDGTILVGTGDGAYAFSPKGEPRHHFGKGLTNVVAIGAKAFAVDSKGSAYDHYGELQGRFPFVELVGAVAWRDGVAAIVSFADGAYGVGEIDFSSCSWRALDVPLPWVPRAIGVENEALVLVGTGRIMRVTSPPPLLLQRVDVPRETVNLSATADGYRLRLPPSRPTPFISARHQFRVDNGTWQAARAGEWLRLDRLPVGDTLIELVSSQAGQLTAHTWRVRRAARWWQSWPGYLLYTGLAGLTVHAGLVLRTRRLTRKARELERAVSQRTAQLEALQRGREEFFSVLSHEMRNPLNGVVGVCEILGSSEGKLAPRESMLVKTLRACTEQLRSTFEHVLELRRSDARSTAAYPTVFAIVDAIQGAVQAVDPTFERSVVTFNLDGRTHAFADVTKLRQAVTNLVSNAHRYGVPPFATVEVAAHPDRATPCLHAGDGCLRITVVSTGRTFSRGELDKMLSGTWAATDQPSPASSRLGLLVSQRVIQAMGGSLTAESTPRGNTFTVEVPVRWERAPVEQEAPSALKGRVLAIEDEAYNRLVLGFQLRSLGLEVDWATDEISALERVSSEWYDVVVTDYLLDGLPADAMLPKLRAHSLNQQISVVTVTAYATEEKRALLEAAGVCAILSKPVTAQQLVTALEEAGVSTLAHNRDTAGQIEATACVPECSGAHRAAEDLNHSWNKASAGSGAARPQRADTVHRLRSLALALGATQLASDLGLLEAALRRTPADAQVEGKLETVCEEGVQQLALKLGSRPAAQARSNPAASA